MLRANRVPKPYPYMKYVRIYSFEIKLSCHEAMNLVSSDKASGNNRAARARPLTVLLLLLLL